MAEVNRRWTEAEKDVLREAYESGVDVHLLPKRLKRSRAAVVCMATKLGCGGALRNSEDMMLRELVATVYGNTTDGGFVSRVMARWREHGLPVRRMRVTRMVHYMVRIDVFWTWAEQNRYLLSLAKLEPLALGPEPEWAREKREWELKQRPLRSHARWTRDEYERLLVELERGKDGRELELATGRSLCSINCILKQRGSRFRASANRVHVQRHWREKDRRELCECIRQGMDFGNIAERLGRTEAAVKGFCRRYFGSTTLRRLMPLLLSDKDLSAKGLGKKYGKLIRSRRNEHAMAELMCECARNVARRKARGGRDAGGRDSEF